MKLIYPFTSEEAPALSHVGGKALSLIFMYQERFPVPPGFVLSVDFFQPWMEHIQQTPEWQQVLGGSSEELKQLCDKVKALVFDLKLDSMQRLEFAQALDYLRGKEFNEFGAVFAVRSSSPEEDLEGASFAGGYETSLGVREEGLVEAMKRSFASCFDARVLMYKREHGYPIDEPRIAVVVQKQVPSQVSGVAFSLNPVNNCYDEAIINANYGLGETVVAGLVTPDTFVVDKVERTILEWKIGKKEKSICLDGNGGTYVKFSVSQRGPCLKEEQVLEVLDLLLRVEERYHKPIDIEWAYAEGGLYLLQARPITAYVPLPGDMLTKPGEPRRLYLDLTLYKQGIDKPLSVMGLDFWERVQRAIAGTDAIFGIENGLIFNLGGRTYSNLTRSLNLQSKAKLAAQIRMQDALSAEIVENLDDSYSLEKYPWGILLVLFQVALRRVGTFISALRNFSNPIEEHATFIRETKQLELELEHIETQGLPPEEMAEQLIQRFGDYMINVSLPVTIAAEIARSRIKRLFRGDEPVINDKLLILERVLPNNITIEMGLDMYRLARCDVIKACSSIEELGWRMRQKGFSRKFLSAWERFMEKHGMRCPFELDLATRRLSETPMEFYRQLRLLAVNVNVETNPQAIYDKGVSERQAAYEFLLAEARRKGKRQPKKFEKYYKVLVTFGGYRETFKYYIVVIVDKFRKRALSEARTLVDIGRLDNPEQVFDLTIDEFSRSLLDGQMDLRALSQENTRFLKVAQRVREFPLLIDSRGKILRAPRKWTGESEIIGEPISVGKVRGRVKVLEQPDEKRVLPGEILVARATDPGWTPLFLNAGGIVLEIGGMLQHGALVAREYGKPCVAGVENATRILKDGQEIELDGAQGVIRLIPQGEIIG